MTVLIDSWKEQKRIRIPNALIFNRLTAILISHCTRSQDVTLPADALSAILHELQKAGHMMPDRTMVDIESADGKRIKIFI